MASKKRSAWAKQKEQFRDDLWGSANGLDSAFAHESARRDRVNSQRDAARRYQACDRKNRYDSRYEAEAVIADCAAHGRRGLTCYKCEYCNGWHLTSHGRK